MYTTKSTKKSNNVSSCDCSSCDRSSKLESTKQEEMSKTSYPKNSGAYLQTSGIKPEMQKHITAEKLNGGAITLGVPEQVDAQKCVGISEDGKTVTILHSGVYFLIAAPQTGFTCSSGVARFWLKKNGENVANSNIQLNGDTNTKDVIVLQAILECDKCDKIQVCGNGHYAQVEAIQHEGEPLVPSVIFSIFKI